MLGQPALEHLHKKLARIFFRDVVLLGGSYYTGQANERSDVDFYVLKKGLFFYSYRKKIPAVFQLKSEHPLALINIAIIPYWAYFLGLYYTPGVDQSGRVYPSRTNMVIKYRDAIKLAYYSLILLEKAKADEKLRHLFKLAQHLAVAQIIAAKHIKMCQDLGVATLVRFSEGALKEVLMFKQQGVGLDALLTNEYSRKLFAQLEELYRGNKGFMRFSLLNYCWYNIKFVPKRKLLFLFANPDKMIIEKMRKFVLQGAHSPGLVLWIGKYVFPIVVL